MYPFTLDEPLLWLVPKKNPWTIRMACEGTQIIGDMGSGKTSGSGRALALAMLKAGFGGLVLTKKTDECALWTEYCRDAGRLDQLLIVHPKERWRFNFLGYQFERAGEGGGYVENAVNTFLNVIENRRDPMSGHAERDQSFWMNGVRRLLRNGMNTLLLGGEPVTMDNLHRVIEGLPYAHPQTGERIWPKNSFLSHLLMKAMREGGKSEDVDLDAEALARFFENEYARPGTDRQSAGIVSTYTGMADPFLSGPVKMLFCTSTNFVPEFSRRGAVIVLNLPTDEWEEVGRTAQLTFKYIWQRCILRRQGLPDGEVPVFLWADEAQTFITGMDRAFQEASRSSVACTVFLTPNINNYLAAFQDNAEAQANALLAGLGTKIFHRNGDHKTNQWAAETIAKGLVARHSGGTSSSDSQAYGSSWGNSAGSSSGAGGGSSNRGSTSGDNETYTRQRGTNDGWRHEMDYQIQPELFTRLKAGGEGHAGAVEAIIFRSGAEFFPHGGPFTGVTFKQKAR